MLLREKYSECASNCVDIFLKEMLFQLKSNWMLEVTHIKWNGRKNISIIKPEWILRDQKSSQYHWSMDWVWRLAGIEGDKSSKRRKNGLRVDLDGIIDFIPKAMMRHIEMTSKH